MTQKTFSVAGVSTFKGATKVRFANDFVNRIKILNKNLHTDVELIELGTELSKEDVCKVLVAHPKFQGVAAQVAIAEYLIRNVKTAAKHMATPAPKAVQTPQVPALKGMTPMGFNLSECEDAPF
jgi:transcription elongation factor GreA-like protein